MERTRQHATRKVRGLWVFVALFAFWTIPALIIFLDATRNDQGNPAGVSWIRLLLFTATRFHLLGLATYLIYRAARTWPITRQNWIPRGAMHLGLALAFAIGYLLLASAIDAALSPQNLDRTFDLSVLFQFWNGLLLIAYALSYGIARAVEFYRRGKEFDLQRAALESELSAARFDALTTQLQPHFLFNSLHSVSTLMETDVRAAQAMLARLGELLRRTIENTDRQETSLGEELKLMDAYLDIERVRFEDRLAVRRRLDQACLEALVPMLILQPIVENAVRHGIAPSTSDGVIEVRAQKEGRRLKLTVQNSGPEGRRRGQIRGKTAQGASGDGGVGLRNVRDRLFHLYNDEASVMTQKLDDGGYRVVISLPFRPSRA